MYYKYVVLGHPINFDYLCEPAYAKFLLDEKLAKGGVSATENRDRSSLGEPVDQPTDSPITEEDPELERRKEYIKRLRRRFAESPDETKDPEEAAKESKEEETAVLLTPKPGTSDTPRSQIKSITSTTPLKSSQKSLTETFKNSPVKEIREGFNELKPKHRAMLEVARPAMEDLDNMGIVRLLKYIAGVESEEQVLDEKDLNQLIKRIKKHGEKMAKITTPLKSTNITARTKQREKRLESSTTTPEKSPKPSTLESVFGHPEWSDLQRKQLPDKLKAREIDFRTYVPQTFWDALNRVESKEYSKIINQFKSYFPDGVGEKPWEKHAIKKIWAWFQDNGY